MKKSLSAPFKLGAITIPNRAVLAPLAGVSDVPFRRICQEHGAGLTYVEMLSATAICYGNRKTFDMMARHASESILGVQVTGPTVAQVEKAVLILQEEGFQTIDINMGCPVRKVVTAGCGSGFLLEPQRISETLSAARSATTLPLSVKFRLGWTRDTLSVEDTAERAARAQVDMCTIHGRTRSEGYDTRVDVAGILRGVETVRALNPKLAILGNGDVFSQSAALKMIQKSGCDGVMVSRGALGNPWVFEELLGVRECAPSLGEWLTTVGKHLDYQQEHYGDNALAARLMRKHLLWYARGFPNTRALRAEINSVESLKGVHALIAQWAAGLPQNILRSTAQEENTLSEDVDPKFEMDRELDRGVFHL
jgi:tRNA-dihydrouridine synthase B